MAEKLAGVNSIMEAIRGRRKIHKIFVQEGRSGKKIDELIQLAEKKGIYYQYVDRQRIDSMYTQANHQGVVAQVEDYEYASIEEVFEAAAMKGEEPFLLILDGIEDPQNLGSIIRTAECAGVHGVILPRHGAAEITAAVVRASAGAVEHMLICREANLVQTMKKLKEKGMWITGADMDGEAEYYSVPIPMPVALVIGGEGKGVKRLVRENCDLTVRIPMHGQVNSLNASVAAGLVIFEVMRQGALSG
ncbi:MAG: 23S rRNA (guanosine(2251)-2'-O)-methyltransferase RlmB [Bacillota bacterium]|nr:23S rRNA (guanosine(2251)-2'-O)-methyltransferase RlmB [Bacillota bacterium]